MSEVVGVRFKTNGKIYYFDPVSTGASIGNKVITETARGLEFGTVVIDKKEIDDEKIISTLKPVIRIATDDDLNKHIDNKNKAREAMIICDQKCKEHGLDMKLINCEYTFDNSKLLFYFIAEGRVDFRELVRDLAAIFKTRIELRQIGVRDEAKVVGGLGCCGRECCCSSFLSEFTPVSIKMAKDQDLSLKPSKISGLCGRLMCCLNYEQEGYSCIIKRMPKYGEIVKTPEGEGTVVSKYTIQELVKVKFSEDKEDRYQVFELSEIERTFKKDHTFYEVKSSLNEEESSMEELKSLERE